MEFPWGMIGRCSAGVTDICEDSPFQRAASSSQERDHQAGILRSQSNNQVDHLSTGQHLNTAESGTTLCLED